MGRLFDRLLGRSSLQKENAELLDIAEALEVELSKARGGRVIGYEADYRVARDGIAHPRIDPRKLTDLAENVWILGTAIDKIVMESTREGGGFEPNFAAKCRSCGAEYDSIPDVCERPGCESNDFAEPDPAQLVRPEEFLENVNPEKTWKDLVKSGIEYNIEIDDVYFELILTLHGRPAQLWALPSERMRPAVEKRTRSRLGNDEWFCTRCYDGERDNHFAGDERVCPDCSRPLVETAYVEIGETEDKIVGRWARDEVLHYNSRARGLSLFGRSKLVRLWTICQILRWQEVYQWQEYSLQRAPDSITAFPDMSQDAVNEMLKKVLEFKRKNPAVRKHLFLGSKDAPTNLKLMDSLADLQAVQMSEILREAIAISLGVSLQSLGVQTPGKLGRETEVVEVSFDTIEEVQAQFEEFVNGKILPLFTDPAITDWHYELHSPKKDDLLRKAQIKQLNASTIVSLRTTGAEVEVEDDETLDFKITELKTPPPAPAGEPAVSRPVGEYSSENGTVRIPIYLEAEALSTLADLESGTLGDYEFVRKDLSPRKKPPKDAVSGLATLENQFAKDILARYEKEIQGVIETSAGLSEKELRTAVEGVVARFESEIAGTVDEFARDVYVAALEEEARTFGDERDVRFTQRDENALKTLTERKDGFVPTLKTFGEESRKTFEKIIREAYAKPEEFDLDRLVRNMRDQVDAEKYKLERIARTETTRISNQSRANQWKKYADPEDHYEFIIARDHRLCPVCEKIAAGNPYTLKALRRETNRGFGDFVVHPGCRCTIVRRAPKEVAE